VSHGSGPCLPDEVSSGAATYPMALGSASLRGKLRCCHVSHGPRQAVDHRNKEMLSCPRHARALLRRLQDMHATTMRLYSATSAQLTTPGHDYSGDMTQQDGTTALAMFSTTG
jgi:hypothetical protein